MYNIDVYIQALRCKCFAINSRLKNKSTRSTEQEEEESGVHEKRIFINRFSVEQTPHRVFLLGFCCRVLFWAEGSAFELSWEVSAFFFLVRAEVEWKKSKLQLRVKRSRKGGTFAATMFLLRFLIIT